MEDDTIDRAKFTRRVYTQELDDPLGCDLVVNLGTLGLEPAVEVVATALTSKLRAFE